MEDCYQAGEEPLMYSQFCYYIQQEKNKRRATMHINRKPAEQKDKPNAGGSVGNISTWIIAALRKEQFFTISELNAAIKVKLKEFNHHPFQKKAAGMNWRNGNKSPFSSIITYLSIECYTQFHTNTSVKRSMYG